MSARTIAISHGLGATVLAVGLLLVGAAAADDYHLPFIHGWALVHGTIFVVFPIYFTLSYFLLRLVAQRFRRSLSRPKFRPNAFQCWPSFPCCFRVVASSFQSSARFLGSRLVMSRAVASRAIHSSVVLDLRLPDSSLAIWVSPIPFMYSA